MLFVICLELSHLIVTVSIFCIFYFLAIFACDDFVIVHNFVFVFFYQEWIYLVLGLEILHVPMCA